MEVAAQNFEKRFFINRSLSFNVLPKFYVTHRIYEILSKSLVPNLHPGAVLAMILKDGFLLVY
jgi:hypothetical protein